MAESTAKTNCRWSAQRKPGFTISHPILATAPGCTDQRHPFRWCKCKMFRSLKEANKYIQEQSAEPNSLDDPRDTEHIECNCTPTLGAPHCHLCSDETRIALWPCSEHQK